MSVLKKLSDEITEVYDLELQEELTEIFNDVVSKYKELIDACEQETNSLKVWGEHFTLGQKMYREKCDEFDKIEKEKKQVEYDRDYYEKYSKELLCEINRK